MRSRWGGFRVGRRRFTNLWDSLKSPASITDTAPENPVNFDYTNAQGIWSIKATTQFTKAQPEVLFVGSRTASSANNSSHYNYLTGLTGGIDTQARPGDLVIIAHGISIYSDSYLYLNLSVSGGWTNIFLDDEVGANDTYGVKCNMVYKIMSDPAPTSALVGGAINNTGTVNYTSYYARGSTVMVFRATRGTLSVNTDNKISYATNNGIVIGTRTISSLTPGSAVVAATFAGQSTTAVRHTLPDDMTQTSSFGASDTSCLTNVTGFKSNIDSTSFSMAVGNGSTSSLFTAAFMAVEIKATE